jgi:AcrR family transcriptional regulator
MSANAPKPLSGKTKASREAILTAALELFLQRGVAATRVEDIASRAGVGKGSVYLHCTKKEELFEMVVAEDISARLLQAEVFASEFSGSANDLLATLLNTNLVEFWNSSSTGIYKLIIAESQQYPELAKNYYQNVTRRARKLFEDVLELGIEQGEYRAIDVPYTARIIVSLLDNELILAHSLGAYADQQFDAQRFIDALLAMIAHGAGPLDNSADANVHKDTSARGSSS